VRADIRRALRKPPRVLARRLLEESSVELERLRAPRRAARFDDRRLLAETGAPSLDALWSRAVARAPFAQGPPPVDNAERARVLNAAEDAVARRVLLLGFGPAELGTPVDWLRDPRTGDRWQPGYAPRLSYVNFERPSDVKLPWEISRMQWLLPTGQAYLLTGDERYAEAARDVIDEWIAANPYAGTVNWSVTLEVALRILSWSWLLGALGRSKAWGDAAFRSRFLRALWLHGDYTVRHLERSDVNGNHFTANCAGLVFAGLLFEHDAWAREGWRLLVEELPRQVYADGVDFEASAAYHRFVCELFLLPALYRDQLALPVPKEYHARLESMGRFTAAILHPDGEAPLWGDTDDARALPLGGSTVNDHRYLPALLGLGGDPREARWLLGVSDAGPLPPRRSAAFPAGGVYVLAADVDHVVIDCGPVGLAGRGGHGHNDCLSFEATLDGVRVVTDSGTYVYSASAEERNRFRATAAHNTPQVDGAELNRIPPSLWQLEDDARPEPLLTEPLRFRGAHSGYLRLPDPVRPVRTIALDPVLHALVVHDAFEASAPHDVEIPFHLAPGFEPIAHGDSALQIGSFVLRWLGAWEHAVEVAWMSPSYGVRVATSKVVFRRSGPVEPLTVTLAPAAAPEDRLWAWAEKSIA
jgi:Heparinase II/III-like protein/Heparinase II/III N-terminus